MSKLDWVERAVQGALHPLTGSASTWDVAAVVIVCGEDAFGMVDAAAFSEIETARGKIPVRYSNTTEGPTHLYGIDGNGLPCVMALARP